ncbi:hypothetical protein EYR36_007349 [Pleurotus pulmonarius]|nr:hypothetical protein EYR36_007349 [Pleurotus pulmonarius]
MKPRDYCCCAIPTINAGIYTVLAEQFSVAIIVGVLSVATPSIVGAATPSFAPWILAIICFVAAAIQVLGFIGAHGEKPVLFRRYVTLHILITVAAFSVAAVWAIISATRHSTAKQSCITNFFPDEASRSQGDLLCEIFPWVDVGIMGGLWLLLLAVHIYFYVVISSYGTGQRRDHAKYNQINDNTMAGDNIPMDARYDSNEDLRNPTNGQNYNHLRQDSVGSVADIMGAPVQQPKDGFSNPYNYSSPPQNYQPYKRSSLSQPSYAYTQDPGPTPMAQDYYSQDQNQLPSTQRHPDPLATDEEEPRYLRCLQDTCKKYESLLRLTPIDASLYLRGSLIWGRIPSVCHAYGPLYGIRTLLDLSIFFVPYQQ